ncbi:MAG: single-stranded DNA-binding protein [Tepidisphaeraceae bacterium]
MASYNRIILMGNLTRDPQLRYLPNQTPVVDIGLAVNHKYRTASGEDREEVMFIDCTAFGKQAEVINQYCQKGRPLHVEGRLKLDTWDDKQTGQKRSKHKVTIDNFQLLGSRDGAPAGGGGPGGGGDGGGSDQGRSSEGGDQRPQARGPARQPQAAAGAARPAPEQPFGEEQQFKEDDIPF